MTYKELEKLQELARAAFVLEEENIAEDKQRVSAFHNLVKKLNAR